MDRESRPLESMIGVQATESVDGGKMADSCLTDRTATDRVALSSDPCAVTRMDCLSLERLQLPAEEES
jgi:hypothetical protein